MTTTDYVEGTEIPVSEAREILRTDMFARELILEYMNGASAAVSNGEVPALIAKWVDDAHDPVWVLSVLAATLAEKCADALPTMAAEWLQAEIDGTTEYMENFLGGSE